MPNFTRMAIKAAFLKLLDERPLSQITVKDIVEHCGINRNSFYYHFEDMPSLLEEIIKEKIDGLMSENPAIESLEDCMRVIISFGLKNKRAMYHIYNSMNRDILERYLLEICQYAVTTYIDTMFAEIPVTPEDKELIIRYFKCECFGQVIDWMNEGMGDEILKQLQRFCDFNQDIVKEMLQRSIKIG